MAADDYGNGNEMHSMRRINSAGKVTVKFLIWPSIILSILLTLILNIIF